MRLTFKGVSLVIGESYDPDLRCGGGGPVHGFYVAERALGWVYGVLLVSAPDRLPSVWLEVHLENEAIASMARGLERTRWRSS